MDALSSKRVEGQHGTWLNTLIETMFGQAPYIKGFRDIGDDDRPVCFKKIVVMRHKERMSNDTRVEVYDLIRCKAREESGLAPNEIINFHSFLVRYPSLVVSHH
ncbi:hypothetical protein V6N13_106254 [Hibiscus sabdariffa]|uniref:Uncharacterized protein n=1 Tax=Hibiscus sabdariffa TaxID=183260 RepID=A0ABR2F077_9ROSI